MAGFPDDSGYKSDSFWTGTDVPANNVSWYEAAQFVNWLNTSKGYNPAYKFIGTQGQSDYTFSVWKSGDVGYNSSNPYRNDNAHYFLPTGNEWVKAAYWNGTSLQTYATKNGEDLIRGDGVAGTGWNYNDGNFASSPNPWSVGSGSEELNGTYDIMGNVLEWMESPYNSDDFSPDSIRDLRGGSYSDIEVYLSPSGRYDINPKMEMERIGFRVASVVPEPATLALLGLGGLVLRKRRK